MPLLQRARLLFKFWLYGTHFYLWCRNPMSGKVFLVDHVSMGQRNKHGHRFFDIPSTKLWGLIPLSLTLGCSKWLAGLIGCGQGNVGRLTSEVFQFHLGLRMLTLGALSQHIRGRLPQSCHAVRSQSSVEGPRQKDMRVVGGGAEKEAGNMELLDVWMKKPPWKWILPSQPPQWMLQRSETNCPS